MMGVLTWGAYHAENLILKMVPRANRFPPLFIVGAPRCGTTVVSLHLVNAFEFSYFPNVADEYPQTPVLATALASLVSDYTPTTKSNYGIVEGLMSPSDGWNIFHRWFPKYDHSKPVETPSLGELRQLVAAMEILMGGPFLNKNNNNSTRIHELAQLFPRSLFIHVRRKPRDAIASLIQARVEHNVPPDGWWSVAPPQSYDTAPADTVKRAVLQICEVNAHIRESLERLRSDRSVEIGYRNFCDKPAAVETWVAEGYRQNNVELASRLISDHTFEYSARCSWNDLSILTRKKVNSFLSKMEVN